MSVCRPTSAGLPGYGPVQETFFQDCQPTLLSGKENKSKFTMFENHRKSLIASEASYVYKLIKNAKIVPFWRDFETLKRAVKQCYQTGQF